MKAPAKSRQERQRERILELLEADPSRSSRNIAKAVGCSPHTVIRLRREHMQVHGADCTPEPVQSEASVHSLQPPPLGNDRALKHGAESEQRLAPLRVALEESLRSEFGQVVDARRLFLLADLLARIEAARSWLDERGGVVRTARGEVFPVVDRLERWSARADALLKELHAEKREAESVDPAEALRRHVAQITQNGEAADGIHSD